MSLCGYRKLLAERARSRWLIGITFRSTQWADDGIRRSSNLVSRAFYLLVKYACLLFANLVSICWQFGTQVMWEASIPTSLTVASSTIMPSSILPIPARS